MPIYEYICGKCGKHFEKRQSFEDEPVAQCPSCNSNSKRLIQCVPVIFKGAGFYVTDYRKDSSCTAGAQAKKDDSACVTCPEPKKECVAAASEAKSTEKKSSESKVESKKEVKAG